MGKYGDIFQYLTVITASFSLIAEFLTLFLIHKIKKWNGFMLLIYAMTLCSIIFDIYFYFEFSQNITTYDVGLFIGAFGGLSVTIWTNIISSILLYSISMMTFVDIYKNLLYYCLIALAFPIMFSMLGLIISNPLSFDIWIDAYYIFRILSIIFNVVIYFIVYYIIKNLDAQLAIILAQRKLEEESVNRSSGTENINPNVSAISDIDSAVTALQADSKSVVSNNTCSNFKKLLSGSNYFARKLSRDDLIIIRMKIEAVRTLAFRMKYYPICQIIVRFCTGWNEAQTSSFGWNSNDDTLNINSYMMLLSGFVTPTAGFLFFIVFLIVQPKAWTILKSYFESSEKELLISPSKKKNVDEEYDEECRQSFGKILEAARLARNQEDGVVLEENDDGWCEYIDVMDEEDLMRAISVTPADNEGLSFSIKLGNRESQSVSLSTSLSKKSSNFGENEDENSFDKI